MKLIIGIGNPEKRYDGTRHNVGFAAIDALARRKTGAKAPKWSTDKELDSLVFKQNELWLAKPLTFVNHTGSMVAATVEKYRPEDVLFVCDDINLDFGKIRLRRTGSSGGHHGLESVIDWLNTENFARLRIGVRNEALPKDDVVGFVLGKFGAGEKKELKSILEKAASVCEIWAAGGFEAAQSKLSRLQSIK